MNTTTCIIPINTDIADKIGLDPAVVLQQIKYWTEKCGKSMQGEKGLWIYNSFKDWHKQFPFWSLSKVKRVFYFLEDSRLLIAKRLKAKKYDHTKYYSINTTKVNALFGSSNTPSSVHIDCYNR